MFYNDVSLFYEQVKIILWSIHTFWYKGLSDIKENEKFGKKGLYLSKIAAPLRRLIFRKVLFGIWRLVLSRYHIK